MLDVMPGEVLKGRVRSVGTGISPGKPPPPGTLPQVQNSRDWLRQAQRFPVAVEFDPSERERLRGVRIGGQADVLVYTGDHAVDELACRRLHQGDELPVVSLLIARQMHRADKAVLRLGDRHGPRPC